MFLPRGSMRKRKRCTNVGRYPSVTLVYVLYVSRRLKYHQTFSRSESPITLGSSGRPVSHNSKVRRRRMH